MKNKANILHKINSFKNNIIEGKKEKSKSKSKPKRLNPENKNSPEMNSKSDYKGNEHRNSTAICISAQRIKRYQHMKITAKNKDNNKDCLSSNKRIKQINYFSDIFSLSDKAANKSIPKNIKQNSNIKKQNIINTTKRHNSSTNILIRRNKSIDNMTQIIINKSNENKKNKKIKKNTDNNVAITKNNILFQENEIIRTNQIQSLNNNNYNYLSNIANYNNNYHNLNNNNIIKSGNSISSITIGTFNNTYNTSSNVIDLSNRNYRNTSIKSKTRIMPKYIYNPILDNNFLNHNLYKTNRNSSKDKIEARINKFNNNIQNILIINNEEKSQKKYKINKTRKRFENEKIELNNIRNNRKTEIGKRRHESHILSNNNINDNSLKKRGNLPYQYLILKGNASYLIKYCMCHRVNWVEGFNNNPENSQNFNFKWKELSYGIDYCNLNKNPKMKQMVNHFEFHHVISNKANLFVNLMKYCEKKNLSVFKYVPFTIVFKIKDRRKIKNKAKQKRWMDKLEKLKNFIQSIDTKVKSFNVIGQYFNDEEYIQDKKNRDEFELLKQQKKIKKDEDKKQEEEKYKGKFEVYSDIFPRLKRLDKNGKNKEQNENKEKEKKPSRIIGSNTLIEIPETHFKGRNMWVLKAVNLNRGMCIKVVNSFQQMEKVINKFKSGVDYSNFTLEKIEEQENNNNQNDDLNMDKINEEEKNQNNNMDKINKEKIMSEEKEEKIYNCNKILIQKYIESPLLYKGRKCDMRIWVLLTHDMKVYLFKEGHLKTCSVEYNLNSEDAFTHITNYSFQKHNSNFQKFEKGNEVPFYEFQKFIDETYPEKNYKLKTNLMNQIKEIIKVTMLCGKNRINRNNRNFQFEIFGYDFMMDSDFNVFLIEINFNPGLEISSPWIQIVVPRMLDDALRLTLDKVFEPVYDFSKNYKGDYTQEQFKLLNNSEIKIDFNAVNTMGNQNPNNKDINPSLTKDSSSQISSLSKTSAPLSCDNKLFNINLDIDDFDKNIIKDPITEIEKNIEKIEPFKEDNKNEKEKEKKEKAFNINKNNKKKKQKYISPFPVPGYSLEENLWEFICDLNIKEGNQNNNNNKENKDKNFTGIKHLLKKKKIKGKDSQE